MSDVQQGDGDGAGPRLLRNSWDRVVGLSFGPDSDNAELGAQWIADCDRAYARHVEAEGGASTRFRDVTVPWVADSRTFALVAPPTSDGRALAGLLAGQESFGREYRDEHLPVKSVTVIGGPVGPEFGVRLRELGFDVRVYAASTASGLVRPGADAAYPRGGFVVEAGGHFEVFGELTRSQSDIVTRELVQAHELGWRYRPGGTTGGDRVTLADRAGTLELISGLYTATSGQLGRDATRLDLAGLVTGAARHERPDIAVRVVVDRLRAESRLARVEAVVDLVDLPPHVRRLYTATGHHDAGGVRPVRFGAGLPLLSDDAMRLPGRLVAPSAGELGALAKWLAEFSSARSATDGRRPLVVRVGGSDARRAAVVRESLRELIAGNARVGTTSSTGLGGEVFIEVAEQHTAPVAGFGRTSTATGLPDGADSGAVALALFRDAVRRERPAATAADRRRHPLHTADRLLLSETAHTSGPGIAAEYAALLALDGLPPRAPENVPGPEQLLAAAAVEAARHDWVPVGSIADVVRAVREPDGPRVAVVQLRAPGGDVQVRALLAAEDGVLWADPEAGIVYPAGDLPDIVRDAEAVLVIAGTIAAAARPSEPQPRREAAALGGDVLRVLDDLAADPSAQGHEQVAAALRFGRTIADHLDRARAAGDEAKAATVELMALLHLHLSGVLADQANPSGSGRPAIPVAARQPMIALWDAAGPELQDFFAQHDAVIRNEFEAGFTAAFPTFAADLAAERGLPVDDRLDVWTVPILDHRTGLPVTTPGRLIDELLGPDFSLPRLDLTPPQPTLVALHIPEPSASAHEPKATAPGRPALPPPNFGRDRRPAAPPVHRPHPVVIDAGPMEHGGSHAVSDAAIAILSRALDIRPGAAGRLDDVAAWIRESGAGSPGAQAADCVPLAWAAYAVRFGRPGNRPATADLTSPRFSDMVEVLGGTLMAEENPDALVQGLGPGQSVLVRENFHNAHVFWLMAEAQPDADGRAIIRIVDAQRPDSFGTRFTLGEDQWSRALRSPGTRIARFDAAGRPMLVVPDAGPSRVADALVDTRRYGHPNASGVEFETAVRTDMPRQDRSTPWSGPGVAPPKTTTVIATSDYVNVYRDVLKDGRTGILELTTVPYNVLDGETDYADRDTVERAVAAEYVRLVTLPPFSNPALESLYDHQEGFEITEQARGYRITGSKPGIHFQQTTGLHLSGIHDLLQFAAANLHTVPAYLSVASRYRHIIEASLRFGDRVAARYAGVPESALDRLRGDFDVMTVRGFAAIVFEHAIAPMLNERLIKLSLPVASRLSLAGMRATASDHVQTWLEENADPLRRMFVENAAREFAEIGKLTSRVDILEGTLRGYPAERPVEYTIRQYLDNAFLPPSEVKYLNQYQVADINRHFDGADEAPRGGFRLTPLELRAFGSEPFAEADEALRNMRLIDDEALRIDRRSRRMLRSPQPVGVDQPMEVDFAQKVKALNPQARSRVEAIATQVVRDAIRAWAARGSSTAIIVEGGGNRSSSSASEQRGRVVEAALRTAVESRLRDIAQLLDQESLPDRLVRFEQVRDRHDNRSSKPGLDTRNPTEAERRRVQIWTTEQSPRQVASSSAPPAHLRGTGASASAGITGLTWWRPDGLDHATDPDRVEDLFREEFSWLPRVNDEGTGRDGAAGEGWLENCLTAAYAVYFTVTSPDPSEVFIAGPVSRGETNRDGEQDVAALPTADVVAFANNTRATGTHDAPRTLVQVDGLASVATAVAAAGDGAHGFVIIADDTSGTGHVVNVLNNAGALFVDGQTGEPARLPTGDSRTFFIPVGPVEVTVPGAPVALDQIDSHVAGPLGANSPAAPQPVLGSARPAVPAPPANVRTLLDLASKPAGIGTGEAALRGFLDRRFVVGLQLHPADDTRWQTDVRAWFDEALRGRIPGVQRPESAQSVMGTLEQAGADGMVLVLPDAGHPAAVLIRGDDKQTWRITFAPHGPVAEPQPASVAAGPAPRRIMAFNKCDTVL